MLSRGTGGRVIVNRHALVEAVDAVTTAQSAVYILGFRPGDRRKGRIAVKVSGLPRGSEVSYREGFGLAKLGPGMDALQLADILTNDVPQTGVHLDAGATLSDRGAEIAVSFSRAEVVAQLGKDASGVELFIYVFDEHGIPAGFKSKRIGFDGAARVANGYVTVHEPFGLPKGRYAVKVLLRVDGTNSLGFVRRDFVIE